MTHCRINMMCGVYIFSVTILVPNTVATTCIPVVLPLLFYDVNCLLFEMNRF